MSRIEAVLATIGEQAARAEERLAAAERFAGATERLRVPGRSADDAVQVTVDGVGQLVDVDFRGRLEASTPGSLRRSVLQAHRRARQALTAEVSRLARDAYGSDSPSAETITAAYARAHGGAGGSWGEES
ncbi:YbaB/EbfC family nucleoid-associated protein [Nocardioides ferulae]|uniref:YbaB/EbfC family nucleoid-associated protein n=1 Tax=Nocardioides ferulae TaxID=2340821 RepID=UPI000EAC0E6C|nr:YbaB/EbfC family nucleoid-associated protein [Nocardioides ferulae]